MTQRTNTDMRRALKILPPTHDEPTFRRDLAAIFAEFPQLRHIPARIVGHIDPTETEEKERPMNIESIASKMKCAALAAAVIAGATWAQPASAGSYAPGLSDPQVIAPAKTCWGRNFIADIFGHGCGMEPQKIDMGMNVPGRNVDSPVVGDPAAPVTAPAPVDDPEPEDEPCYLSGADDCEPDSETDPASYADWLEAR